MTRVTLALAQEAVRIKKASEAAVERATVAFGTEPDKIKAMALIRLALLRGQITPQEGAQLSRITSTYATATLAERIVLAQSLAEFGGLDVSKMRPPIYED